MLNIDINNKIKDALVAIELNHCRAVIVTDQKKLVGVVSQGDILRAVLNNLNLNSPLSEISNPSVVFVTKPLEKEQIIKFFKKGYNLIPIVDTEGNLIEIKKLNSLVAGLIDKTN